MSDYVQTCSYGKATMDMTNSKIVTVKLPCSGTARVGVPPVNWTYNSCSNGNLIQWMLEAEYQILNVLKVQHKKYRHHVLITPRNMSGWAGPECSWSGTAVMGFAMGDYSWAWINGDGWDENQVRTRVRLLQGSAARGGELGGVAVA